MPYSETDYPKHLQDLITDDELLQVLDETIRNIQQILEQEEAHVAELS